ncbi:hypothetical protein BU26DRAFT_515083, partial [Trematosphaeria pertusa]
MVGGYTWGLLDGDFVTVAAASVGSNPAPLNFRLQRCRMFVAGQGSFFKKAK